MTSDHDPDPPISRTIVLVGLMGAGKTCIGKRLASRLGVEFLDADAEIEKAAGMSITEIFEVHGEAAFRDGERRVIGRLLQRAPHVLATGGGAFMNPRIRELIAQRAISVWLRADLDLLVKRTSRRNHRPLLRGGNHRQILGRLKAERDPAYATADIVVDTGEGPAEATVDKVEEAVRDFVRRHRPAQTQDLADDIGRDAGASPGTDKEATW